MFGFFKKKNEERHYDPTQIRLKDMRLGWFVDYDFKTWQAVEEYEYEYARGRFSHEFKLQNADGETLYLDIDEEGEAHRLLQKLRFSTLPQAEEIEESIQHTEKPPRELRWGNMRYYRERENKGYFRNIKDTVKEPFMSWEYADDSQQHLLEIEQWDDDVFEAYIGEVVPERHFSNITPCE